MKHMINNLKLFVFILLITPGFLFSQRGNDSKKPKAESKYESQYKDLSKEDSKSDSYKKDYDGKSNKNYKDDYLFEEKSSKDKNTIKKKFKEEYTYNYFKIDPSGRTLWNGKHWNESDYPLTVYIDKGDSKYYLPEFKSFVDYSMSVWKMADERIKFNYVYNEDDADIVIVFEENLMKKYDENFLGLTNYELGKGKKIEKAIVEVSLLKYDEEVITAGEIKTTLIHEMGHALGLGHSENIFDIMFPFIDPYSSDGMQYNELSLGDSEALQSVIDLGFEKKIMSNKSDFISGAGLTNQDTKADRPQEYPEVYR
ncbi:MAG TPA: matrixin family metalloprotease [Ignavibacteriaceae bacterium]|nr:matrixin family metalloprotease [Ignavibacteriaceae bacterium]